MCLSSLSKPLRLGRPLYQALGFAHPAGRAVSSSLILIYPPLQKSVRGDNLGTSTEHCWNYVAPAIAENLPSMSKQLVVMSIFGIPLHNPLAFRTSLLSYSAAGLLQ